MKSFYIFDLIKNLFRRKNFTAIIYLFLNLMVVAYIFLIISDGNPKAFPFAILVYFVAVFITLSPLGEWWLSFTMGCRKIKDKKILSRLEPLFFEVYERTQNKHSDFPVHDNITLYILDDKTPNAFALGRRTVCVTSGLLSFSNQEIKAIFGHEMGHLATHDTDLSLLITVGNFFISAIVGIISAVIFFYKMVFSFLAILLGGSEGFVFRIVSAVAGLLKFLFVDSIMYLWTMFGVLLVMKSSRNAEYEADAFSCDLGYSEGMLSFFHKLIDIEGYDDGGRFRLFAVLNSSHPATSKRIARIEENMGIVNG